MVGVPGRSKACITCRERRKGCDLARPECARCKKAGLPCAGYPTHRAFVLSTPKGRQIGYKVPADGQTSGSPWNSIYRDPVSSSITGLCLLTRPEEERRSLDLFWEAYFPCGRRIPAIAIRSYTCTWTETAQRLYREDDSLRYILWANCLLVAGRRHGVQWMRRESSKLYGRCLVNLRKSFATTQGAKRNASIATVKLLSMYEASSRQGLGWTTDESQDWQRHHAGELALFMARTPAAHTDGDAHHVFADERVELALSSILWRKGLALSTPEWKNIPWQEIPKDLKDVLVDVLVDIPGLVEDLDRLRRCTDAGIQAHFHLKLVQDCWEHDRQLRAWLGLVHQLTDPGKRVCKDPASPESLVTHIAQVHGMSLYWTSSLVVYSILREASGPEAVLPAHTDPMYYACNLVDAIITLTHPNAGLYGKQSAVPLLEVALLYIAALQPPPQKIRALVKVLKDMKHEWPKDIRAMNITEAGDDTSFGGIKGMQT
ncbi:hypothetical protein B0T25DRAFT_465775 [Lasiosphaeria hispida]|uniref:Zn(2)-C6 fungal-type domain-containing protein n=1 Tax=Lasiosphaeria hispida TaxID=260671 RepID=A0AAJ0M8L5_9PEZI|nr:hypothetical protein B0T25DRAFT_465775 [Lasiosphaeria hispida]